MNISQRVVPMLEDKIHMGRWVPKTRGTGSHYYIDFCVPSTANLILVHCEFEATHPSQLYLRNETYEHTFYYIQGLFYPKRWLGCFSLPIRLRDVMCEHMALGSLLALC